MKDIDPSRGQERSTRCALQAALEGISLLFSSGDDGDVSRRPWFRVSGLLGTSSPLVAAVGGTALGLDRRSRRGFEVGWGSGGRSDTTGAWASATSCSCTAPEGGTSVLYREPRATSRRRPESVERPWQCSPQPGGPGHLDGRRPADAAS